MNAVVPISPRRVDHVEIAQFVDALFRHADPGSFVLLRAFEDGEGRPWKPWNWQGVEIGGGLVEAAVRLAQRAADADERVTFCPPVATFLTERTASERNVANGLALLVECDDRAEAARAHLERVLGPVTVAVESGGQYRDPNGAICPRLHLYWRLTRPTRNPGEHAALKELRRVAQALAGSDASAVPICHPIRWPGSWHRKADPVLARIVALSDAEIVLDVALDAMALAAAAANVVVSRARTAGRPEAPIEDIRAALAVIPNPDLPWAEWVRIGMAIWRASGASNEGLEAFHEWSEKAGKYHPAVTEERWDHFSISPPNLIGAESLFADASKANPRWVKPSLTRIVDETFDAYEREPEPEPLPCVDPSRYHGCVIPERRWLVPGWVPMDRATGLYGAGGEGKSLLAQMLATACALGRPWLGLPVTQCRSLLLFCEDDLDEMLRRQEDINRAFGCGFADLDAMRWLPRLGEDNALMTFATRPERTPLFGQVLDAAKSFGAQLVVTDTLTDVFIGNENDRAQARAFAQQTLAHMARELSGAVIAPAHPSRAGIRDGTGESGSTAWQGTFRSRLWLATPVSEDGEPVSSDLRVLTKMKVNAARRGEAIELRWRDGVFVPTMPPTTSDGMVERRECDAVFLSLLDDLTRQGRHVSPNLRASNYAPRVFARHPDRERFGKAAFEIAMEKLLARRLVGVGQYRDEARRLHDCLARMEPFEETFEEDAPGPLPVLHGGL